MSTSIRTWIVTTLVTALAGVLRLVHLGRPSRLVFDETYYVKQAYSLLHLGYEGTWAEGSDPQFAAGDFSGLSPVADYVVHPGVGKWMIAAGMAFFDPSDPVGWRIAGAITGTASVALVVLIGRYLINLTFGAVAGLFLAVDGIHIVMSRTGILDIFLSFWVLAAFGALLLARRHKGWLVLVGVCLGLATGVKWSGIYVVAVFGVIIVTWQLNQRWRTGERHWFRNGIFKDGALSFLALVPTAALTYLATWIPWALQPSAYMREDSLWNYHKAMWDFHTGLDAEHTYMSHPAGWLLQIRPTSFAWQQVDGGSDLCGADSCISSILALGNPVLWWGAALALPFLFSRDWRAWAILAGYLGGFAPWFLYPDRTMFTFYTVVFVPFVALALAYVIRKSRPLTITISIVVVACGIYFWPIWTGAWVPYWFWQAHMFFPSWI